MTHTKERIEELFQGLLGAAARCDSLGHERICIPSSAELPDESEDLILRLLRRTELQTLKAIRELDAGEIPERLAAHRGKLLGVVDDYLICRLKHYTEDEPERALLDWRQLLDELPEPELDLELHVWDFPEISHELSGQIFGRLQIIGKIGAYFLCRCSCGRYRLARRWDLEHGNVQSCGCLALERLAEGRTTHGKTGTRLYQIWDAMRGRCQRKRSEKWPNYGGRGISVCDEWQSFEAFEAWALANGYTDELTLDRINNDGDYTPENCRWATRKEQANNTRRNILVMYKGQLLTLKQAAEASGIAYSTLRGRRAKIPPLTEEELFRPSKRRTPSSTTNKKANDHKIVRRSS